MPDWLRCDGMGVCLGSLGTRAVCQCEVTVKAPKLSRAAERPSNVKTLTGCKAAFTQLITTTSMAWVGGFAFTTVDHFSMRTRDVHA
jgi:hypothetical protein